MPDQADLAFLILTAEDPPATGEFNPRMNVVHQAGLLQGKLGFRKAILFLEEGCQEFSNVRGLTHIPFPKGKMKRNSMRRQEGIVTQRRACGTSRQPVSQAVDENQL